MTKRRQPPPDLHTLVGYARVSKADGSQSLALQIDALQKVGVSAALIFEDHASGKRDDRPGLAACLKTLRHNDVLVVWKLDRLGRDLEHLTAIVRDLERRGVGLRVLTGEGAHIDTTTPAGRLVFGIFSALAEYERELIRERTLAGLAAARARGRIGGSKPKITTSQLRYAQSAMEHRELTVKQLCAELKITRQTLYRYVDPNGALRPDGERLLAAKRQGK